MTSLQKQIISELAVSKNFNVGFEIERRIHFLIQYFHTVPGCKGFVLGISGGQDSTLAGKIAQLAVEKLVASGHAAKFVALRLPYKTQFDEADAQEALTFINPDETFSIQIEATVDALSGEIERATGEPVSDFNKGNIKARARMMAQYAIAGDRQLLVLGSDHAAEAVTGFFTKFGDGAADAMPLAGLTKNQGALMLQALGAASALWEKDPTADLLDGIPGESDEAALGVTYKQIDSYLSGDKIEKTAADNIELKFLASRHKRKMPVNPNDDWWK